MWWQISLFPFQKFRLLLALTQSFGDEKEIILPLVGAVFSGHSCPDPLEINQEEIGGHGQILPSCRLESSSVMTLAWGA